MSETLKYILSFAWGHFERRWGLPLLDNKNRREKYRNGWWCMFHEWAFLPYILERVCALFLISCLYERDREENEKGKWRRGRKAWPRVILGPQVHSPPLLRHSSSCPQFRASLENLISMPSPNSISWILWFFHLGISLNNTTSRLLFRSA